MACHVTALVHRGPRVAVPAPISWARVVSQGMCVVSVESAWTRVSSGALLVGSRCGQRHPSGPHHPLNRRGWRSMGTAGARGSTGWDGGDLGVMLTSGCSCPSSRGVPWFLAVPVMQFCPSLSRPGVSGCTVGRRRAVALLVSAGDGAGRAQGTRGSAGGAHLAYLSPPLHGASHFCVFRPLLRCPRGPWRRRLAGIRRCRRRRGGSGVGAWLPVVAVIGGGGGVHGGWQQRWQWSAATAVVVVVGGGCCGRCRWRAVGGEREGGGAEDVVAERKKNTADSTTCQRGHVTSPFGAICPLRSINNGCDASRVCTDHQHQPASRYI